MLQLLEHLVILLFAKPLYQSEFVPNDRREIEPPNVQLDTGKVMLCRQVQDLAGPEQRLRGHAAQPSHVMPSIRKVKCARAFIATLLRNALHAHAAPRHAPDRD